jgi:hypothetical protein
MALAELEVDANALTGELLTRVDLLITQDDFDTAEKCSKSHEKLAKKLTQYVSGVYMHLYIYMHYLNTCTYLIYR